MHSAGKEMKFAREPPDAQLQVVVMLSEQIVSEDGETVLRPGDFLLERRSRNASLTEAGMTHALAYLGATPRGPALSHFVHLRADQSREDLFACNACVGDYLPFHNSSTSNDQCSLVPWQFALVSGGPMDIIFACLFAIDTILCPDKSGNSWQAVMLRLQSH